MSGIINAARMAARLNPFATRKFVTIDSHSAIFFFFLDAKNISNNAIPIPYSPQPLYPLKPENID